MHVCVCVYIPSCPSCPVSLSGCPPGTRRQLSFQSAALIASPQIILSKVTVHPTPDPPTELTRSKCFLSAAPPPSAPHHSTQTPSFPPAGPQKAATSFLYLLGQSHSFLSTSLSKYSSCFLYK